MTAVGDVTFDQNASRAVCLMTAQTTTTAVPTLATQGVPSFQIATAAPLGTPKGAFDPARPPLASTLMVSSSAGSGTMTATLRLWGYVAAIGAWVPVSSNPNDITKSGFIYNGVAIPENTADQISYSETLLNLGHYDRLYLQCSAIGGTATAIEAWLVSARRNAY